MDVTGLVLAAHTPGAGVDTAVNALRAAGCREVIVVLGDGADAAVTSVPRGALPVVATDWNVEPAAALKAGMAAAATSSADAVVISTPDAPWLSAATARAVIAAGAADVRNTLARAHRGPETGYPVLIGRHHWADLGDQAVGENAAHAYLNIHLTVAVDCTSLI